MMHDARLPSALEAIARRLAPADVEVYANEDVSNGVWLRLRRWSGATAIGAQAFFCRAGLLASRDATGAVERKVRWLLGELGAAERRAHLEARTRGFYAAVAKAVARGERGPS